MPLKDSLSALKVLLLECQKIPLSIEERRDLLIKRVPELSAVELDDLLKIPVAGLETYQKTIFGGESNIIQNHFKCSLATIKLLFLSLEQRPFDLVEQLKLMQVEIPWQNNYVPDLASNFCKYIKSKFARLIVLKPWLAELLDYELQVLLVRRSINVEQEWVYSPEQFKSLDLSCLMESKLVRSQEAYFAQSNYDILAICEDFKSIRKVAEDYPKVNSYFSISRNLKKLPVSLKLEPFEYLLLQQDLPCLVKDYFIAFNESGSFEDEIIALQKMLLRLQDILNHGVMKLQLGDLSRQLQP